MRFSFAAGLLIGPALLGVAALPARADLFVSSGTGATSAIFRITGTGTVSTFLTGGLLNGPRGIAFGPDGNLYVANNGASNILRITLGGVASVFASTATPNDVAFDSLGNLYVTNPSSMSNAVVRFNAAGTSLGKFNVADLPGARGIAFAANGEALVTSSSSNNVTRLNTSGIVAGTITNVNINSPREIEVQPSGNILVLNNGGNNVSRFDAAGAFIGNTSGGISNAQGLTVHPLIGDFYVANGNTNVTRFSATGTNLGTFNKTALPGNGFGIVLVAAPEPASLGLLGVGLLGFGLRRRRSHRRLYA